jgi:penicillin-binding protein 2
MENRQVKLLSLIVFLFLLILLGRLFQLQVLFGQENLALADNNRTQRQKIIPPRGLILDRHGEILADSEPVYLLEGEETEIIPRQQALELQAANTSNLKIVYRRRYPKGEALAHILGYLGQVSLEELKKGKLELKGYASGSLIGQTGIESQYEELLRGREGSELIEVNTRGEVIRRMGQILPTTGKSLTLALDWPLQQKAIEAYKNIAQNKKGAVIAQNPQTGEVLAFYSSPSFDPNIFLKEERREDLISLITDEQNQPLLNRTIAGLYPPGSTFKIVTSIAGLEEGKITPRTKFVDTGIIHYGAFSYSNWYFTSTGRTEGEVDVARALARSTDTFFYKLGEWVGIEKLNYWGEKLEVNKKTGIDLPGELAGFMATPEWKEKNRGERWFLGNTYHMAIGQGDLAMTPIGVNRLTEAVANGGELCRPRMLKIGAENTPYGADCREIGIKKEYIKTVKEGMIQACSSGGTAGSFAALTFKTACKTGTAETGDGKTTHAWFTAFAPACAEATAGKPSCQPEIAVTVLVDRGGEGSSIAAPIVKEILKEYFKE